MLQNQAKYQDFDVIKLEERLASDFEKMQNPYKETSIESFDDDYVSGEWDAKIEGFPSCPEKWLTSKSYKQGFVNGLIEKYDDQFAQLF